MEDVASLTSFRLGLYPKLLQLTGDIILVNDIENLRGIISLLSVGDVQCDKCDQPIKHLDRYCCNTLQCPICDTVFDSTADLDTHFNQEHTNVPSRAKRYCVNCSLENGYIKMVKSKKNGEVFPAIFVTRDEERIE